MLSAYEKDSPEYKVVKDLFESMKEVRMFRGLYDAKHGDDHYMYGVMAPMECIAYLLGEDYGDSFSDEFIGNMVKSQERAKSELQNKEEASVGKVV